MTREGELALKATKDEFDILSDCEGEQLNGREGGSGKGCRDKGG